MPMPPSPPVTSRFDRSMADLRQVTTRVIKDLIATNAETSSVLADAARRPQSMNEQSAAEKTVELRVELCVWRLLAKDGVDEVVAMAPDLRAALGEDDDLTAILDAWIALRTGTRAATQPTPTIWTKLAVALAKVKLGANAQAVELLLLLAQQSHLHRPRAATRTGTPRLGCDPAYVNPLTSQIDRLARDVPLWVDAMIARPTQHQRLIVDLAQRDANCGDGPRRRHACDSATSRPCPSPSAPAIPRSTRVSSSSRRSRSADAPIRRGLSPDVFDIDQRLRLMPGEEITERVWPATRLRRLARGHRIIEARDREVPRAPGLRTPATRVPETQCRPGLPGRHQPAHSRDAHSTPSPDPRYSPSPSPQPTRPRSSKRSSPRVLLAIRSSSTVPSPAVMRTTPSPPRGRPASRPCPFRPRSRCCANCPPHAKSWP